MCRIRERPERRLSLRGRVRHWGLEGLWVRKRDAVAKVMIGTGALAVSTPAAAATVAGAIGKLFLGNRKLPELVLAPAVAKFNNR